MHGRRSAAVVGECGQCHIVSLCRKLNPDWFELLLWVQWLYVADTKKANTRRTWRSLSSATRHHSTLTLVSHFSMTAKEKLTYLIHQRCFSSHLNSRSQVKTDIRSDVLTFDRYTVLTWLFVEHIFFFCSIDTTSLLVGQNLLGSSVVNASARGGTHTDPFNCPFVRDYPGEPVPERQNQPGFYWSKRQWVAVASSGPYASLLLAPDR